MLPIHTPAPAFCLHDQEDREHCLEHYRGRWLILFFYPRDMTPGCTREACRFRDLAPRFSALEAQLLGVSLDSRSSHLRFVQAFQLPFPLLSDPEGKVAKSYQALWRLGPFRLTRRISYLIDPSGRVSRAYRGIRAQEHADFLLRDLQDDA